MQSKPTYIELENILKQTQDKLALKENNFERIKSSFYSNISHEQKPRKNYGDFAYLSTLN